MKKLLTALLHWAEIVTYILALRPDISEYDRKAISRAMSELNDAILEGAKQWP